MVAGIVLFALGRQEDARRTPATSSTPCPPSRCAAASRCTCSPTSRSGCATSTRSTASRLVAAIVLVALIPSATAIPALAALALVAALIAVGARRLRAHPLPRRARPPAPRAARMSPAPPPARLDAPARAVLHRHPRARPPRPRAQPGAPFIDLGRGNPDLPPPAHAIEALRAAALETADAGGARLPAVPGPCRSCARRSPTRYRGRPRRDARPRPRGRGRPRDQDGDHARLPGRRRRRRRDPAARPRLPRLPLGRRAGRRARRAAAARRRGRLPARLRRRGRSGAPRALPSSTTPPTRARRCERPGTFEAAVAFAPRARRLAAQRPRLRLPGLRRRAAPAASWRSEGARDVAIELWSPSKIYGMAGWRIGFAVGAAELDRPHPDAHRPPRRGRVDRPAARAGRGAALRPGRRRRSGARSTARAATCSSARCAPRAPTSRPPEGSFFVWWRLPARADAASALIEQARVGVAPGRGVRRPRRGLGAAVAGGRPTRTSPRRARRLRVRGARLHRDPAALASSVRFRCMAEAPTVLVVDDDAGFRAYVRAALEPTLPRSWRPPTASRPLEVAARASVPTAILLDWRMPGQSGITVCRALRAEPELVRRAHRDDHRAWTTSATARWPATRAPTRSSSRTPTRDALAFQVRRLLSPGGDAHAAG